MIVFNTLAKAKHYVKHKQKQISKDNEGYYYDSEDFCFYTIRNNRVLCVYGWRCGCGCDRGSTTAKVIGKIKSISNEIN